MAPGLRATGICARALSIVLALAGVVAPFPSAVAANTDVGYRDFAYTGATAPTGQKPQSKLWWNDGIWWGSLFNPASGDFEIHRLDWATQRWSTTGVTIDERSRSQADALWDGRYLYVATSAKEGVTTGDLSARVLRYSYNAGVKAYTRDAGFPVTIAQGAMEAIVIDKDSTGRLWTTWTASNESGGRQLMISHSTTSDLDWTAPFTPPVDGATTLNADDISTLVAYDGQIGVMWSNQNDSTVYFATHRDGDPDTAWSLNPALQGPGYADDHMNVKSLQADPSGRVFAVVKTSLNDKGGSGSQPLMLVLTLDQHGGWKRTEFSRVVDDHTRPLLLIDSQNRRLYVFAAAPCCNGGVVYYKHTSLDDPKFEEGLGQPFIRLASDVTINNATSTKQPLNSTTGLVVLAGDDGTRHYVHNAIPLGSAAPPSDTTPPTVAVTAPAEGATVSGSVAISASASDDAGVARVEFLANGQPLGTDDSAPYGLSWDSTSVADGAATITARAVDAAGNGAEHSVGVSVANGSGPAPLFSDGFESGDFSAWSVVRTGGDGSATVQSTTVRSGSYAARLAATANTGSLAYARSTLSADQSDLTISGDFQVAAQGSSGGNVPLLRLFDAAGTRTVSLYRQNGTSGAIWIWDAGTGHHATSARLPLGSWARVELRVRGAGTAAASLELLIDGAVVYQGAAGLGAVRTLQLGNETARQVFTVYADTLSVTR